MAFWSGWSDGKRWLMGILSALIIAALIAGTKAAISAGSSSRASITEPRSEDPISMKLKDAWVKLYDDEYFADRVLTVTGGTDIANFDQVNTDDGKKGFEDKATSVRWNIPQGWVCALYEDKNYKGRRYALHGSSQTQEDPNLGDFGDECSSLRWEQE